MPISPNTALDLNISDARVKHVADEELSPADAKCKALATPEAINFGPIPSDEQASLHLLDRIFQKHSDGLKNIDFLEILFGDPELMLGALDKESFEESLNFSILSPDKKTQIQTDLPTMTVRQFYSSLSSEICSSSCGQTAMMLEQFLCGEVETHFIELPNSLVFAERLKEKVQENVDGQWFCRVDAGGHDFTIEYSKQNFRIYQSFMNSYTLSKSLKTIRSYPVDNFLQKIQTALSPNPMDDGTSSQSLCGSRDQKRARQDLFLSRKIHPDKIKMKILPHNREDIIEKRIEEKIHNAAEAWSPYLDQPIQPHLEKSLISDSPPPPLKLEFTEKDLKAALEHESILDDFCFNLGSKDPSVLEEGETYYFKRFGFSSCYQFSGLENTLYIFNMIEAN